MQLASGYENRRARIEMVPLMDIIFLQLVYFIYAMLTMSVNRGVHVALPEAAGALQPVDSFAITVTRDDRLLIAKQAVTMDEAVAAALREAGPTHRTVVVRGDRQAGLGIAVELLSRLRNSGIQAVSFLVEKENRGQPPPAAAGAGAGSTP